MKTNNFNSEIVQILKSEVVLNLVDSVTNNAESVLLYNFITKDFFVIECMAQNVKNLKYSDDYIYIGSVGDTIDRNDFIEFVEYMCKKQGVTMNTR